MGTTLIRPEPVQAPKLSGGGTSPAPTIGRGVKIVGQISSKEDLYVNGEIEGTLVVVNHKLTVGSSATIHADVKAREVVLLGTIRGNVEATEKIEIRQDARLVGDIRTPRIIIEDGAYFKGSIDITQTHVPHLTVLGSREADAADARAEQDIGERRYITLDDTNSLNQVLSEMSDEHPGPLPATIPPPGQEPAWGLR
jgi:cytoskeletal protein CcmA (bactofilin family)